MLDFGIAKMSALDEGGSRLTRTGMIFGTPEYMSPEQARGDKPDHRVDIYAAGCILYEMLTGDVPFHAETFMGVLTKHMFEEPMPPSQRAPTRSIPPDVEAVCLKALAKDRDQRFQTMKEMALALEACVGGDLVDGVGQRAVGRRGLREPSQAFRTPGTAGARRRRPRRRRRRRRSWRRRRRSAPGSSSAASWRVLLAGGGAAVVLSQKKPVDPPKPVVAVPVARRSRRAGRGAEAGRAGQADAVHDVDQHAAGRRRSVQRRRAAGRHAVQRAAAGVGDARSS